MPEEKKENEVKEAEDKVESPEISEDDFTDEHPYVAPVVEEKKVEEKKPEPVKPAEVPEPTSYEYSDVELANIEQARQDFFKQYKKDSKIKTVVSVGVLLLIVAGWIVPYTIPAWSAGNTRLIISLCVVGVCIVALGVYSVLFRKHSDKGIKAYFNKYYGYTYKYALRDLGTTGYHGDIDNKLDEAEFNANGLYGETYKVGSRFGVTFNYRGTDFAIVDCASQRKGKKALETTFVGKYMRAPNTYQGTGLIIYFKGNERALPPSALDPDKRIEDNERFSIYGEMSEKKFLTKKIRTALAQVRTNKTLVDVAIAIKEGKTYFLLGYEDNLMVIPLQKAFNPAPVEEFKKNLEQFVEIAMLLDE